MREREKGEGGAGHLNYGRGGAKFKSADLKICINYVMNIRKFNIRKD